MTGPGKIYFFIVTCAFSFILFMAGYSSSYFGFLENSGLDNSMRAAKALQIQLTTSEDEYPATTWVRALDDRTGVVELKTDLVDSGLTLYTAGDDTVAKLIDMNGVEVWSWRLPFDQAWKTVTHLKHVAKARLQKWRKAVLYPNGDLLVIYEGHGVTPSGQGLAKIDKDSKLIWNYSEAAHHDIQLAENGNIYTLIYSFQQQPVAGFPNLKTPMLIDSLVILDPDGIELKRIDILEAFVNSPWRSILRAAVPSELGDYFHTNSAQPLSAEIAAAFDFAEPGNILISIRNLSTIALIDPETETVIWAMRGPWIAQHDAEMLANGSILIFDNRGDIDARNGKSRILEFNPVTHEIIWLYNGSPDIQFNNIIRGAQQRLSNGNTLITSSNQGRLFEVTPDNEIVWDFRNPIRGEGKNDNLVSVLMWAERHKQDMLTFLN